MSISTELQKEIINPQIKGTFWGKVYIWFYSSSNRFFCLLDVVYSERGDFRLSFAPKIFDIGPSRAKWWLKIGQKMAEIWDFRGTNKKNQAKLGVKGACITKSVLSRALKPLLM